MLLSGKRVPVLLSCSWGTLPPCFRRHSNALALDLGGRSMNEFAGLENQLMLAMESIQAAEANLG
ncbi:hypothetical protein F2Q69_00017827 [Brassica cretica]|uniref:Uncharacterized protein n=1 Tax=Brassica cretica TaxID=69181 RepID=A0A8S9QP28_BRACR|nr:hypothetical protein F2Q69_00017827 [Brassica cretica]